MAELKNARRRDTVLLLDPSGSPARTDLGSSAEGALLKRFSRKWQRVRTSAGPRTYLAYERPLRALGVARRRHEPGATVCSVGPALESSAAVNDANDSNLRITVKDIEQTEALETKIREKAGALSRFYDRITSCHVTVESPERRHHKGKLYNVHVLLHVPGEEIVVSREPNEDLYVAIRDAFEAAKRQLQEYVDRRRGR
jgi:ribosomal subunit interface protein